MRPTLVTVLRHGAVAAPGHVLRGLADPPLSPAGRAAMLAVLERLHVPPVDHVVSSPRRRCREVAEVAARDRGWPLRLEDGFAELDFGRWEGLTPEQAAADDPAGWRAFRAGEGAAPGGESWAAFQARVLAAWQAWLADARGGHRLLLTHAGVMRILLREMLHLPFERLYRLALPEAAHFQVSVLAGEAPILLSLNPCADWSSLFSS